MVVLTLKGAHAQSYQVFQRRFSICAIIRFLGADGQVTKMYADLGDYDHQGEWR